MISNDKITTYMRFAAELAWKGCGTVEPNPMVGAVLVKNGKIIGHGHHKKFGGPHAEIEAIEMAKNKGKSPKGALLVVTLEPCGHHGKTPPCTDAIMREKIKHVVYGEQDQNPKVKGTGLKKMKKSNIPITAWSIPETQDLYKHYKPERPIIHLKTACTITGEITLKRGKATMLSSPESLKYSHKLRAKYDGILVGRGTVEIDNPRLTVRLIKGKNPIRIVLDSEQKLSPKAAVFHQPGKTWWMTTRRVNRHASLPKGTELIQVNTRHNTKRIDLNDLMKTLQERGIRTLLAEGGEILNTELIKQGMVDQISLCITSKTTPKNQKTTKLPKLFKDALKNPFKLGEVQLQNRGGDLWIEGKIL